MNVYLMLADIVAIALLMLCFYLPRNGRRELVSSFLITNIGVLAVATAMSAGTIAAGLGLGLFGVLSIIRLRSEELSHREIAYYFASLSLGLLGGLTGLPLAWSAALMALVLAAIAIGDHPRVTAGAQSSEIVIDQAISDPQTLEMRVAQLVNGTVTDISVRKIDLINDSTTVQARFKPIQPRGKNSPKRPVEQTLASTSEAQQAYGLGEITRPGVNGPDPYQPSSYQDQTEPAVHANINRGGSR